MEPTPRKLTTHQKSVLIQVLLAFPEQQVSVCFCPSASDGLAYAEDFLTIFRAIGWDVTGPESANMLDAQPAGLAFIVSGEGSCLPPSSEALRDALCIYGIEVGTFSNPARKIAAGSFVLAVGAQR